MVRLALLVLTVLALTSCAPTVLEPGSSLPSEEDAVAVEFVADGDTFRSSDGTTFRLDGINAPESEECYYAEAADGLADLLEGATVLVTATGTDQFGRTLSQVHADGEWVNMRMVTEGMALATTPEDDESDELIDAEEKAFNDRVGLWAETACGASGSVPEVVFDPEAGEFNPPGPDEDALSDETVVVVNRGTQAVDLSGWSIRDESSRHRFRFPGGATISPGGRLSIASSDSGWEPGSSPVWNNGGDLALLFDHFGRIVDRHRY